MRQFQVGALALILSFAPLAFGQTKSGANPGGGEDWKALDHKWLDAAHNRDTGILDWLFAADFVEVHRGGFIVNKQQQIDQSKDAQRALNELRPDDIEVRYVSPDLGMLTDTTTIRGTSGGVNYDDPQLFIRVFIKQTGRWRAAGAGIVRITAQ